MFLSTQRTHMGEKDWDRSNKDSTKLYDIAQFSLIMVFAIDHSSQKIKEKSSAVGLF